ncbi:MAG: hypothetical protein OXI96_08840, partial [Acidimicrobiaceae bacterium]|nr:hypothetical protein [Acidimicrobiaceae bacterium]
TGGAYELATMNTHDLMAATEVVKRYRNQTPVYKPVLNTIDGGGIQYRSNPFHVVIVSASGIASSNNEVLR